MNEKLVKTLSSILSKMPKKDLEANLTKAKEVLKNSNNEDIAKLLSNPQVTKILGKENEKIKEEIKNIDLSKIDTTELEKKFHT